jgi:chorismate--pyruvate lyase
MMHPPHYHYQTSEPKWQDWALLRHGQVPINLYPWLMDRGSLTRSIQRNCPGRFQVKVRDQTIKHPLPSERRLLGLRRGAITLIREVELQCADRPWVFARTLIPLATLHGIGKKLAYLGDRPLGAILFADPTVRRQHVEIARLLPHHALFRQVSCLNPSPLALWGRRTLFLLADKPLLVNELFLKY